MALLGVWGKQPGPWWSSVGGGRRRKGKRGAGGRSRTAPTLKGTRNEGRCLLCQYNYANGKTFSDRFVCKFRMASVYQCHYATEGF